MAKRLMVSGWRIIEQCPSGDWRHAMEAPRFFKTREEAEEVVLRFRARYDRLGHNHPFDVEFVDDVGSPSSFYGLAGVSPSLAGMSLSALSGHRALGGLRGDLLRCKQYALTPRGIARCVTMGPGPGEPDDDAREDAGVTGKYKYSTAKAQTRGRPVRAPGVDRYARVYYGDDPRKVRRGSNVPVPPPGAFRRK